MNAVGVGVLATLQNACGNFDTINILKKNLYFIICHGSNENKEMRHIFIVLIFQKNVFSLFS